MPLVNIFLNLSIGSVGMSVLCALWGWYNFNKGNLESADKAFDWAEDFMASMTIFGIVALCGLIFV